MTSNTTVKFNSAVAERRVKTYSAEIGKLRTRLKEAANAQTKLGSAVKQGTADLNHMSRRTRVLTRDIDKLSKSIRTARTDVLSLGRAMNSAGMRRAAATMGAAATPLARVDRAARRASSSARSYSRAADGAGRASLGYSRRAARAVAVTGRVERVVANADRSFLGLAASMVRVRNLALFLAAGFGITPIVEMADGYKLVSARLQIVTDNTVQLKQRQEQLLAVANRTRTSYQENAQLFVKLAQAGEQYGVTQSKALVVTENVAKAMKISGTTASEARAATQQLAQAFASGRIQGDELRSVLENSPRIAKALATELSDLGINLGNIRDKAAEGKIGIDELVRALGGEGITKQLDEEFAQIPVTISDSLQIARNKIQEAIGKFDELTGTSDKIARGIVIVAENFDKIAVAAGFAATVIATRYIPAMISAVRWTGIFNSISLVGWGRATRQAFGQAAASASLFGGVLRTSSSSTLPRWRQVASNAFTAVSLNMSSLWKIARLTLGRIPILLAAISAGSYIMARDYEVVEGRMATVTDYLVTGFQLAAEKIGDVFSWIGDKVTRVINGLLDLVFNFSDSIVRAFGAAASGAAYLWNNITSGDVSFGGLGDAISEGYNSGGIRNLFSSLVDGTSWQRAAEERAFLRFANEAVPNLGLDERVGNRPDEPDVVTRDGGSRTKSETDNLSDEIDRMAARFSRVEKARQEFTGGLKTLDSALKSGLISAERYGQLLNGLATEVFPGMADQIKELRRENEELDSQLRGDDESVIRFQKDTEELRTQINIIDQIIAKDGDRTGELGKQRSVLVDQGRTYAELIAANRDLSALADERREKEEAINALVERASNRLFRSMTDAIRDSLDFGRDSFKNFFNDVFGFFKDTLANIISAELFSPMEESFRKSMRRMLGGQRNRQSNQYLTPTDILRGAGWSVNPSGGTPTSGGSGRPIVVETKVPKGFFENFVMAYKEVWSDTFSDLKDLFAPLAKMLRGLFGEGGLDGLGKTLGKLVGGAQVGSQVAGITQALGIGGSSTGGAIGGAIGSLLPIPGGDIIGGLAGSLLGGLFGSKSGSATITSVNGNPTLSGGSGSRRRAATGLASNVQDSLRNIADQLGAQIGAFSVSIGLRKDNFRVDPTGRGNTKLKNGAIDFGSDEAAAIRFAVETAIEQGAIQGLKASEQALLKGAREIEDGVSDILQFRSVFDRLENLRDPTGQAARELNDEFEELIDLFKRAGASTQEWTELGELFRLEMDRTMEQALETLKNFRDDLIGGEASFRSPTDRLRVADERFRSLVDTLNSGGTVDQNEFVTAGQELQSLARAVFGSTSEFQAIQQRLINATEQFINNVQNDEANFQGVIDAIEAQTNSTNAGISVTNDLLRRLVDGNGNPLFPNGINPIGVPIAGAGGSRGFFENVSF